MRGGPTTAQSRILANKIGALTAELLLKGVKNKMVGGLGFASLFEGCLIVFSELFKLHNTQGGLFHRLQDLELFKR
ncbi:MAG: hypothetical protein ACOC6H_04225 [Thermoproteota archaeon]